VQENPEELVNILGTNTTDNKGDQNMPSVISDQKTNPGDGTSQLPTSTTDRAIVEQKPKMSAKEVALTVGKALPGAVLETATIAAKETPNVVAAVCRIL
jgi:hypothetical protein